jgi:hypothetical protein
VNPKTVPKSSFHIVFFFSAFSFWGAKFCLGGIFSYCFFKLAPKALSPVWGGEQGLFLRTIGTKKKWPSSAVKKRPFPPGGQGLFLGGKLKKTPCGQLSPHLELSKLFFCHIFCFWGSRELGIVTSCIEKYENVFNPELMVVKNHKLSKLMKQINMGNQFLKNFEYNNIEEEHNDNGGIL